MLRFVIEKIMQKKWMAASLFAGTLLFLAIVLVNPLYIDGAMQKLLSERFEMRKTELQMHPMYAEYTDKIYVKDDFDEKRNRQTKVSRPPSIRFLLCRKQMSVSTERMLPMVQAITAVMTARSV